MAPPGETLHLAWASGPGDPLLTTGEIHVWRATLGEVSEDLSELLSAEESSRASRFLIARDGLLWSRSRGVLRALLGRYLHRDPCALQFTTGAHGKPELLADRDTSQAAPLSFSMSHSAGLALYAVSISGPVGVDIEVARRPMNEIAIAARLLGQDEARRLEGLDETTREREFLRSWVRHEAELKLLGAGIGGQTMVGNAWIAQLDVGSHAAGALALESAPRELCCWDWRQGS